MGWGILYRMVAELIGLSATLVTRRTNRRQLQKPMEEWSHNYRTNVDTIYFKQKTIEDIIHLQFNPGEGIAQYRTAERGILIMVC
jgi:hypothetical protein